MFAKHFLPLATVAILLVGNAVDLAAQNVRAKVITRLFWQDRETQKLSYADLTASSRWDLKRGWIANLPTLDPQSQQLVAMQRDGSDVVTTVTGTAEASGGWMAFDSGVFEEPHGNHFHWRYSRTPAARRSDLSPAAAGNGFIHLSDKVWYLPLTAGGFLQMPAASVNSTTAAPARVIAPDGHYARLAVANGVVCYAAHTGKAADGVGRVDVINIRPSANAPQYSLEIPGGPVGSVVENGGKVFLTTSDGLFWTTTDVNMNRSAETSIVSPIIVNQAANDDHVLPLVLVTAGNAVLCVSSNSESSELHLVNAETSEPALTSITINVAQGLTPSQPTTVLSLGKRFAFVFQERIDPASEIQEQLTIVELDPNRDRNFSDAVVRTTIPIGASRVDGERGHHGITFDAYGRYAVFTNPGDGILTLMSLQDLKVRARFRVGGIPERIIAVGAPEHFH